MSKAFIFDLDGVLIDDERIWEEEKAKLFVEVFGQDIAGKLGSTLGINIDTIYDMAAGFGTKVSKEKFVETFYKVAPGIFKTAPIPDGLDELAAFLKSNGFGVGIVSASPLSWITIVTRRLSFENDISVILSLYERPDLPHKPAPHGYIEAMQSLGATPESTVVLEDSNAGIKSAKAAGALTIGLQQNLASNYQQHGADVYAASMKDV